MMQVTVENWLWTVSDCVGQIACRFATWFYHWTCEHTSVRTICFSCGSSSQEFFTHFCIYTFIAFGILYLCCFWHLQINMTVNYNHAITMSFNTHKTIMLVQLWLRRTDFWEFHFSTLTTWQLTPTEYTRETTSVPAMLPHATIRLRSNEEIKAMAEDAEDTAALSDIRRRRRRARRRQQDARTLRDHFQFSTCQLFSALYCTVDKID